MNSIVRAGDGEIISGRPNDCGQPVFVRYLPAELALMLRKRARMIVGCALLGLVAGGAYVLLITPRYEAVATIEISPTGSNSMGLDEIASKWIRSESSLQLQTAIRVLQSKSIACEVMAQLRLAQSKPFAGRWRRQDEAAACDLPARERDLLLARFNKALGVEIVPKTEVVAIRFCSRDPQLAADVANAVVQSYRGTNVRNSYRATGSRPAAAPS